jgi:imidazolonepropionase-like amidohydrolase
MPTRTVVTVFTLALLGTPSVARATEYQGPTVIHDVRVFDGTRTHEHRTVVVDSGRITAIGGVSLPIPRNARVVAGSGATLLPGLIDAHVHVSSAAPLAALRQSLWFGVTTVIDMFAEPTTLNVLNAARLADAADVASVVSAGVGATIAGGHPTQMGIPIPTISRADSAEAFVDARRAEGSRFLKVFYDDGSSYASLPGRIPRLPLETMKALVATAHRRGLLVVAHIGSEAEARDAIDAGVDGLAHTFVGGSVGPDFGRLTASRGVFVIPTLATRYWWCGRSLAPVLLGDTSWLRHVSAEFVYALRIPAPDSAHASSCRGTDDGIRLLARAHATIVAGTDAPSPGLAYGASLHHELELLVGAGLTPMEALTAATSAAARAFRLDDRGEVSVGKRADLVLVRGDPTANIRATRDIVAVWKRGERIDR